MNEVETIDGTIELLDTLIDEKRERIQNMKEIASEFRWRYTKW